MPILDIELVLAPGETPATDLAQKLAEAAGMVFGSEPGRTWVKLRFVPAHLYAENAVSSDSVFPAFVTVLKSRAPIGDELAIEITNLTEAIARACDRPAENVHILYQPNAAGRAAFGGRLVG